MDLADIPAAAAFLGVAEQLPSASAEASAADAASSSATRLHDLSNHSDAMAMDPNTSAAAAALLGSAHFYPGGGGAPLADAAMAQHYYAQNLANFAGVAATGFMPMYGFPMFHGGGAPGPYLGGPNMACGPNMAGQMQQQPTTTVYDMDATALQNQIAAQFTQATPEQQAVYYESVRQQLDTAASGLNEDQKQALLRYDPTLSFTMKPLDLLNGGSNSHVDVYGEASMATPARGSGKRPRTASGAATPSTAAGAATKKSRKNKASSCEPSVIDGSVCSLGPGLGGLLNDESPGSSSGTTTPRPTPRGRPPKIAAGAAGAVQLTPSGKKKSMTPQAEEMRARKAKMTWPKGTFIIRLQDVKTRSGRDHIWLVDNHQLLQRYNNETGGMRADGSRVYHKTDRYTGWLCHEGFHYFPLYDQKHVLRQDGDTVTVLFPSEEDLQQAIEYQEQEKARRAEEKDTEELRQLPPSIRNQPAVLMQQHQQQQRAHSTQSATSMTSKMEMTSSSMEMERGEAEAPSSSHQWSKTSYSTPVPSSSSSKLGSSSSVRRQQQFQPATTMSSMMEMTSSSSAAMEREMPSSSSKLTPSVRRQQQQFRSETMTSKMELPSSSSSSTLAASVRRQPKVPAIMRTKREPPMKMEGAREGGRKERTIGEIMMQQWGAHPGWQAISPTASPSCSASDLPSTSRGHSRNEMPLLSRQDYGGWGSDDELQQLQHRHQMQLLDDDGDRLLMMDEQSPMMGRRSRSHSREFKQEEEEYAEWEDMADHSYRSRM